MKFSKQRFTEDVTIDYNEFDNCQFENCTIYYHGGDFKLTEVKFTDVRFAFGHSANNTLAFLRFLRGTMPQAFQGFFESAPRGGPQSGKAN